MSEAEVIHEVELIGTELEPVSHGNLFRTEDPVEIIRKATELADALSQVLKQKNLTTRIGQKDHVSVEGWTLCGTMLGVFPVVEWTRETENGWEARVEARTLAGQVVGAAEAECLRTENRWKSADDYAVRSMAQTRAISKALRAPLGFIVALAGFSPTPEEEMPREAPPEQRVEGPAPIKPPSSWAKLTEMVAAYDQGTHDLFFQFADSCRRLLFPESTDTKGLNKQDKNVLFQKCAGAALFLREHYEPSDFPPPDINNIRDAFAAVLEGQELAIPDEQLDEAAVLAAEREA